MLLTSVAVLRCLRSPVSGLLSVTDLAFSPLHRCFRSPLPLVLILTHAELLLTNRFRPTTHRPGLVGEPWFVDHAASGLDADARERDVGQFHYAEVIPPGAALFDYDNDGDLDVYLVQGQVARTRQTHDRATASRGTALPQ